MGYSRSSVLTIPDTLSSPYMIHERSEYAELLPQATGILFILIFFASPNILPGTRNLLYIIAMARLVSHSGILIIYPHNKHYGQNPTSTFRSYRKYFSYNLHKSLDLIPAISFIVNSAGSPTSDPTGLPQTNLCRISARRRKRIGIRKENISLEHQ